MRKVGTIRMRTERQKRRVGQKDLEPETCAGLDKCQLLLILEGKARITQHLGSFVT